MILYFYESDIMSRYGSGFREPPWVMGSPKEVMDALFEGKAIALPGWNDPYNTQLWVRFDAEKGELIKSNNVLEFYTLEDILKKYELAEVANFDIIESIPVMDYEGVTVSHYGAGINITIADKDMVWYPPTKGRIEVKFIPE